MLEKIAGIEQHYQQLSQDLESVGNDYQRAAEINKERVDLEPIIRNARDYRKFLKRIAEARSLLENEKDEELLAMAEMEIEELEPKAPESDGSWKRLLAAGVGLIVLLWATWIWALRSGM